MNDDQLETWAANVLKYLIKVRYRDENTNNLVNSAPNRLYDIVCEMEIERTRIDNIFEKYKTRETL